MLLSAIKAIHGPSGEGTAPLLSVNGSATIKDKEGISARLEEHFRQLLNLPSNIDQAALHQKAPQENINLPLNEDEVKTKNLGTMESLQNFTRSFKPQPSRHYTMSF